MVEWGNGREGTYVYESALQAPERSSATEVIKVKGFNIEMCLPSLAA